jgi:16S rRNA (cytidine1402-2'-O)-methyltransferase
LIVTPAELHDECSSSASTSVPRGASNAIITGSASLPTSTLPVAAAEPLRSRVPCLSGDNLLPDRVTRYWQVRSIEVAGTPTLLTERSAMQNTSGALSLPSPVMMFSDPQSTEFTRKFKLGPGFCGLAPPPRNRRTPAVTPPATTTTTAPTTPIRRRRAVCSRALRRSRVGILAGRYLSAGPEGRRWGAAFPSRDGDRPFRSIQPRPDNRAVSGTLYLVGTPIGNLGDITDRARQTLTSVHLVAAEDTRRTGRLLEQLGISARLISFFEGNEAERVSQLVDALHSGKDVALVSDAGMPALSDPGYRLVAACVEGGVPVDVVPGPSAAVAALVASGLPTDRFVFEGFLPRRGRARRDRVAALKDEPRTIVLFESPRRVAGTVAELARVLGGGRRAVVARELTKLHQEFIRGTLAELAAMGEVRGEVVVVVEGREARPPASLEEAVRFAAGLVSEGQRMREAARRAAAISGIPSGRVYAGLIEGKKHSVADGPGVGEPG